MSGIRLAQLAKDNPWQKKKTDTAIRTLSFVNGIAIVSAAVKFKNNSKNNLIHMIIARYCLLVLFLYRVVKSKSIYINKKKPDSLFLIPITINFIYIGILFRQFLLELFFVLMKIIFNEHKNYFLKKVL